MKNYVADQQLKQKVLIWIYDFRSILSCALPEKNSSPHVQDPARISWNLPPVIHFFFQFLAYPLGYAIEYFTLPSEIFIVISTRDSCSNSCFTDFFYFIKIFMINIYKDQRLEIAFSFMVKCNFEKRHQHLKFSFQTRQEQISIF